MRGTDLEREKEPWENQRESDENDILSDDAKTEKWSSFFTPDFLCFLKKYNLLQFTPGWVIYKLATLAITPQDEYFESVPEGVARLKKISLVERRNLHTHANISLETALAEQNLPQNIENEIKAFLKDKLHITTLIDFYILGEECLHPDRFQHNFSSNEIKFIYTDIVLPDLVDRVSEIIVEEEEKLATYLETPCPHINKPINKRKLVVLTILLAISLER